MTCGEKERVGGLPLALMLGSADAELIYRANQEACINLAPEVRDK
jgi:hypothetical protein